MTRNYPLSVSHNDETHVYVLSFGGIPVSQVKAEPGEAAPHEILRALLEAPDWYIEGGLA